MARSKQTGRQAKKKKERGRLKKPPASPNNANPPDINDVLTQADAALESSNIETAMQLYTYISGVLRNQIQALSSNMAATNEEKESNVLLLSKVLGKMAEAKVALGDQGGAQQDFLEATNLLSGDGPSSSSPSEQNLVAVAQWKEARASLYLYLGQLSSSSDALEAFTRAIGDLKACIASLEEFLKGTPGDESVKEALIETRRQLCGAYCSASELYMTDLCFDQNAEQNCESALNAALELDDKSFPDVVQAMANLRLSQNRGFEAVSYLLESYAIVKVGCEAMADLVGLSADDDEDGMKSEAAGENAAKELKGEALEAANSLPGFEFRCQMSKLLLECGTILEDISEDAEKRTEQKKFCIEAAIQVLGSLLAENDEVIEIWFLLGCAFTSTEPKNVDSAKHYFENSLEMLQKVKKGLEQEMPSEEISASLADVTQKISDVQQRLDSLNGAGDTSSKMEED